VKNDRKSTKNNQINKKMSIEFIQNGMELSKVREIINAIIQQLNSNATTIVSYKELQDRPCINGVELTTSTTAQELKLTLSHLANIQEIENLLTQIGEQKAKEVATETMKTKLDSDFSRLPELKYNFNEDMLLTISDKNGIFRATVSDLLLYLKYLILKDTTFEKMGSGGKSGNLFSGFAYKAWRFAELSIRCQKFDIKIPPGGKETVPIKYEHLKSGIIVDIEAFCNLDIEKDMYEQKVNIAYKIEEINLVETTHYIIQIFNMGEFEISFVKVYFNKEQFLG